MNMDIFEMLRNKFDLYEQVNELNTMLFEEKVYYENGLCMSFCTAFDNILFRGWKYSKGRLSIFKLLKDLDLCKEYNEMAIKQIDTEVDVYKSLQLAINLLDYGEKQKKELNRSYILINNNFFDQAINKVRYILDEGGMKAIRHKTEEYILVLPRDEKVQTIAKNVDEDVAFLLYEYTSPLIRGNTKEKRKILKLLSSKYEAIIKIYTEKYTKGFVFDLMRDLGYILNNFELRHPNLDPSVPKYYKENLQKYTDAQWIEIYDTAYQLILTISMIDQYSEIWRKTIEKHKNDIQ